MKLIRIAAGAAFCVMALAGSATAQIKDSEYKYSDNLLRTAIAATFMELNLPGPVPEVQPQVAYLTSSCATKSDDLVKTFFGTPQAIMSTEDIFSPLWGPGTRYKSGTVIYLTPKDTPQQQLFNNAKQVEMVPAYLDVYHHGFIYTNNIPQKPVLATDVKVKGELRADVKQYYVYDEKAGLSAAESVVKDMLGELKLPDGFQSSVTSIIEQNDLRLYVYTAHPQYLTTYQTVTGHKTDENQKVVPIFGAEQPVAIPVIDRYVKVMLDGDKLLAGMEYFWDGSISVAGKAQEAISAQDAIIKAREKFLRDYNLQPPLISVSDIRLAYIQDKHSSTRLVPAWLFDASYTSEVTPDEQVSEGVHGISPSLVSVPMPFAVDAISGEVFDLGD